MDWVDIACVVIILISAVFSLLRGFIREVVALLFWLMAIWIAMVFSPGFATTLSAVIESEQISIAVAFALLLVGILIIGAVVNYFLGRFVKGLGFGSLDKLLGVVFGLARGGVIVAVGIVVMNLTTMTQTTWWQASVLVPKFQPAADWISEFLTDVVPARTEVIVRESNE